MAKDEKSTNDTDTEVSQEEDVSKQFKQMQKKDKNFQKYLKMLITAGELAEEQSLDIDQQQKILARFAGWKEAGMPKLEMPETKEAEVAIPSLLVRVKHLGKQFIWWRDTKGNEYGIEHVPVYALIRDNDPKSETSGKDIEDKSRPPLDYRDKFLTEYTRSDAIKLVRLATSMNPACEYVFKVLNRALTVGPTDFNLPGDGDDRDFDDVVKEHSLKQYSAN